jgi:farnesyl diphosphate synthase
MREEFHTRLRGVQAATEATLERVLSDQPKPGELARPARLLAAMRHAALGGGKRLRPFLVIEGVRLFGVERPGVHLVAAAVECVHCYSLIHDDLPAMDDDDLRRGRPTVHKAFDEATAVLAGDALLTLAFDILTDRSVDPNAGVRAALVSCLAQAAGAGGMAGGQMLDLEAERQAPDEDAIRTLQAMKTGALFRYAAEAGAILTHANSEGRERLRRFGAAFGLAFKLADDLIDATGTAEAAGKATAKDAGRGKATLVAIHGVDGARALLERAVGEASAELEPFGQAGDVLRAATQFVAYRDG